MDANVLMRALEPHHTDRFAEACRDFWSAMLEDERRQIIIPAPSLAEHLRGKISRLPSAEQVYVGAFDRRAAEILAEYLPKEIMSLEQHQLYKDLGVPGAFVKYDAMIVACAKRWEVDCLVSIDTRVKGVLAKRLGLACKVPTEFYDMSPQQLPLPSGMPQPRLRSVPPPSSSSDPKSSGD